MKLLVRRLRAVNWLANRRWRKFWSNQRLERTGIAVMCVIAFWLGFERGMLDGSEFCLASHMFAGAPGECTCERGGSRLRYGQCDDDPVDWVDADLIFMVRADSFEVTPTGGDVRFTVLRVLRGPAPEDRSITLHPDDVFRFRTKMAEFDNPVVGDHLIVMFNLGGIRNQHLLLRRNGYYNLRYHGDKAPAIVHLRGKDIQIYSADTGEPYLVPPLTAPLPDFVYSLKLAERSP